MPTTADIMSVAQAAEELGIKPVAVRFAIMRGLITPIRLDARTNLVPRSEVERYRREHLGQRGKRKKRPARPAEEDVKKMRRP